MDDKELLWKQYELHISLYKSYLELIVKVNIFYYAVTGAIISYYFTHADDQLIKYSLILPLVMSIALGGFFIRGAWLAKIPRKEVFSIRDKLGLESAPDIGVLILLLVIFAVLMLLVASGLLWLLLFWC